MHRLLLAIAPLALVACAASTTPNYDARFGDAVRQARQAQTIHPQGSSVPVTGLDGAAAKAAADGYHDSFKAPPPVVNVINIGGSVAGGGR